MSVCTQDRKGVLIVVTAPSGCGKTTLIARLMKDFPRIRFSVSYTTRKPRPDEVNGEHYHFVTEKEFLVLQRNNFFVEWAKVHGAYYGTPLDSVHTGLAKGYDVLFDIDIQGALQLKKVFTDALYIFIFPPSYAVLAERLIKRGTDATENIQLRLSVARKEIEQAESFTTWIVNDSFEIAYNELRAAYIAHTLAPQYNNGMFQALLDSWHR